MQTPPFIYIYIYIYIKGGVCIYYMESLPVRVISLPYFKKALLLEMTDNNKIIVSVIYHSPSQKILNLTNFFQILSSS